MKNKIILILISICYIGNLHGYSGIRKANRYFELYKYSKAIPLYKKATTSSDEETRKEATIRLADCYRFVNDVSEARSWYAIAVEKYNPEPVNYYYLGQALRSLEKYEEAEKVFLRYAQLQPDDKRGEIMARYCHDIREMDKIPVSVELKNATPLNSKYSDFGTAFYKNGIVLTSDRKAGHYDEKTYEWTNNDYLDLYFSEPLCYQDFWMDMSKPGKMSREFNQTYHDGPASFTSDGYRIFITRTLQSKVKKDRNNIMTDFLQIFSADLSNKKKVKYDAFPFNNENYSVGHPTVSKDGSRLIFSSDMPGGYGGSDLYISEMRGGKWSVPVNLGQNINTFGNEVFPFWYNDSTLYFSSDGHMGYGGLDIYESKQVDRKWGAPENLLKPVNSSSDDFGLVFQQGTGNGFFSSNRQGGLGADDIYAIRNYFRGEIPETPAEKPVITAPVVKPLLACGYVKDKRSLAPVEDATVFLLNSVTNELLVLKTDAVGYYEAPVEKDVLYVAKAMKSGYFDDCTSFRFGEPVSDQCNPVTRNLLLDKYGLNQVFKIDNIYYDRDKSFIRPDARPALDNLVRIMNTYPINIELSSHTDSRASFEYNDRLSQSRADAAVAYLTRNGISASRMTARGYGERMLLNGCSDGVKCSEAEHQMNRRTEFRITSTESSDFRKKAFDASVFRAGDKIPLEMLGSDFFKECFLVGQIKDEAEAKAEAKAAEIESRAETKAAEILAQAEADAEAIIKSDEEKKNREVNQITGINADSWFAVQIKASSQPIPVTASGFAGETGVYEMATGEWYKYYIGKFGSFTKASKARVSLNARFPGCFIVGFKNGKIVPVNELRKMMGK